MTDILIVFAIVALVVTAAGILSIRQQLRVAGWSIHDNDEQSRRQFAIEIVRDWHRSVGPETTAAQRLIEELTEYQCQRIANYETVEIPASLGPLVEACLGPDSARAARHGEIVLDTAAVGQIRYLGAYYLNELEVVLSAWQKAVGDREYLEDQFSFVDQRRTLTSFRLALGSSRFPAIEAFLARHKTLLEDQPLGRVRP